MRRFFLLLPLALAPLLPAQTLTLKVTDPRHDAVAHARVLALDGAGHTLAIRFADARGIATLPARDGITSVEFAAPGFAPARLAVTAGTGEVAVELQVASASETVTVTAVQTELSTAEGAALTSVLTADELDTRQPTSLADAVRNVPGVVTATSGRRGSQASLFIRGGESRYNKVLIDGVATNDPGGTFDFGVVPTAEAGRVELLRGPGSVLYGSDAMTSVVQVFSRTGSTPELRLGADGGTFTTAHGYGAFSGAWRRLDYNLFADELHSAGQGGNDGYGNSSQGANLGLSLTPRIALRLRARHANARTGIQGEWVFNQQPRLTPDADQYARQNNFLGSAELTVLSGARWKHTLRGGEYHHTRRNLDHLADRGCNVVAFDFTDCFFDARAKVNRATFDYQGEYAPRNWARTILGYQYENENGNFDTRFLTLDFLTFAPSIGTSLTRGLRQNHALFAEQVFTAKRVSLVGGVRYVHNDSFGDRAVPQVSAGYLLWRGRELLTGTRLRFAYAEGIKAPRFEESFGVTGTFLTLPNPGLRAERNRAFEAGLVQGLGRKASLSATYFNNHFRDQIVFDCDPITFFCSYQNLNRSLAHGAEVALQARPAASVRFGAAYVFTASQVLAAPTTLNPSFAAGAPLLRRPKQALSGTVDYFGVRWGGNLSAVYIGRRADSDFGLVFPAVTTADPYARFDISGWYQVNRWATAYAVVENFFNRRYEEIVGYPALKANFRAGMRFRIARER